MPAFAAILATALSATAGLSLLSTPSTVELSFTSYCITETYTATTEDFIKAIDDYCDKVQDMHLITGDHYTDYLACDDERCIQLSLYFKCYDHSNQTTIGHMPYNACLEYFELPLTSGEMCLSGGYVGSVMPEACWSALSLAVAPAYADHS